MRLIMPEEGKIYSEQITPLSPLLDRCSGSSGQACLLVRPQGNLLLSMPYNLYFELEERSKGIIPLSDESRRITSAFFTKSVEIGKTFLNEAARMSGFTEDFSFLPGDAPLHLGTKENFVFTEKVKTYNHALGLFFPSPFEGKTGFSYSFFSEPEINDHLGAIDSYFTPGKTLDQFLRVVSPLGEPLSVFTSFPLYQSLVETLWLYENPEYGAELLKRHNDLDDDDLISLD